MSSLTRSSFPKDFNFGVATSAYQIEGHAFGGAGSTHWDSFAATAGNVVRCENGDVGCDHYHRFEEDLDLIKQAGFDSYRFSTSWARIMPLGTGQVNEEGLDFYDRLMDAMLERGIKPMVTLYHWELPSNLADKGGWTNSDMGNWFADFTQITMERLGDRAFATAPINEPWCVSFLSHFLGHHAPGQRDIRATARSMHHVLLAHGRSIEVMRGLGIKNLGGVFNLEWAQSVDESEEAKKAAELYDGYYNRFFLGGVFKKSYPENVLEALEPHLPAHWQDDFDLIGQKLDWCGLNYYTRKLIAADDGPWPHHHEVEGPLDKTQMGWEIYPDGLYELIMRTTREYSADLPLIVTENGMANSDELIGDEVCDEERIEYFKLHLGAAQRAIADGAPLAGYTAWSLLDNYEWALGYEKRFGLVHVDFDTMKRTPKASLNWFSSLLKP